MTISLLAIYQSTIFSQCLSSVNPVGGTENITVLEKKSLRIILFYKYGESKQYYEGSKRSDFDLISKAYYNYCTALIGYGLTNKLTIETETGCFINKSQRYNVEPSYTLTGRGFSNFIVSSKYNLYSNHVKRIYYSISAGVKIPFSRNPQWADNVELPVEVQPTLGAYGFVFNSYYVKENSEKGLRFFITNRVETNLPNKQDYYLGTAIFNSFFVSKHLMFPWLKSDWTTIIQLRNEIRTPDRIEGKVKPSSGSVLFFIVPQVNYVLLEKWYLSVMVDLPVYQYFVGTQLGGGIGVTCSIARTINFTPAGNE